MPIVVKRNHYEYCQLRTMLDSVQSGVLRRYMNAPSEEDRTATFNYLKTNLKPIHDYVRGMKDGDPCPEGEIQCDGYCSSTYCCDPPPPGGGGKDPGGDEN